jgi:hypothetical protein
MIYSPPKKTLKEVKKVDDKLTKMYEDKKTTPTQIDFVDKSDVLLSQMNFIALNNKSFFNIKSKAA